MQIAPEPGKTYRLPVGCEAIDGWCLLKRSEEEPDVWLAVPVDRGPDAGELGLEGVDADGEAFQVRGTWSRWLHAPELKAEVAGVYLNREQRVLILERMLNLLDGASDDMEVNAELVEAWEEDVLRPNDAALEAWGLRKQVVVAAGDWEPETAQTQTDSSGFPLAEHHDLAAKGRSLTPQELEARVSADKVLVKVLEDLSLKLRLLDGHLEITWQESGTAPATTAYTSNCRPQALTWDGTEPSKALASLEDSRLNFVLWLPTGLVELCVSG
jgi:hypothetical protein